MALLTSVPDTSQAMTCAEREILSICSKLTPQERDQVLALARRADELEEELNAAGSKCAALEQRLAEEGKHIGQAREHKGARHALARVLGLSLQQLMIIGVSCDPEGAAARELARAGWQLKP